MRSCVKPPSKTQVVVRDETLAHHGEQWHHDCNQPCTRVGLGGLCPHCSELVAISDLLDTLTTSK